MEKLTTMVTGNNAVMRKAMLDALSLPAFILFFTMMGFGSLARGAGFSAEMSALSSLLIWGLPGQLAMVELTATGQGIIAIVFACSLANARFLPMVVSFVPAMSRGRSGLGGMLLDAQLLSINSWAVCLREFPGIESEFRHRYYLTFASSILLAAVIGTLVGYHGSVLLPAVMMLGLIFISPLFFALVLLGVAGRAERFSMILGCATISIAHTLFPSVDLLIAGIVGGSVGFAVGRSWKSGHGR
ncbi:MAG: AzlC family ABC transporter permease [Gammaproteobacteria bacterium]|nr:AzlC family ABC transporter permease [Gammaproteobacteria bacterium]